MILIRISTSVNNDKRAAEETVKIHDGKIPDKEIEGQPPRSGPR
jgi:hypothetical protein